MLPTPCCAAQRARTLVGLSRGVPNAITGLIANDRKIEGWNPTIRGTRYNRILGGRSCFGNVRLSLIVLYFPSRRMTLFGRRESGNYLNCSATYAKSHQTSKHRKLGPMTKAQLVEAPRPYPGIKPPKISAWRKPNSPKNSASRRGPWLREGPG
jgi:hypothetical protein